jgi:tetratricopeptide (TPR) repeat protein
MPRGDAVSLPSLAEVEHADWPSLLHMAETLGLNPRGRSAVVRMRVADHVRRRAQPSSWRPSREHQAALLTRLGHPDLAERVWESTIQLDAPAPWVGLGQAQLAGGSRAEAMKSLKRAVQMGDPSAELHRAEALAAGGDLVGAVAACDAFLESHARDLRALFMKSAFLTRGGFDEEATKVLRIAVEIHPEIPLLVRTLGFALLRTGRYEAAAEALEEAVRRDRDDVDARAARGSALLLAGRTREAIGVFEEALEINSRRPDLHHNLAVAYLAMGNPRSAVAALERAAKLQESRRILLDLARAQEAAGQPVKAARTYEQVVRLRPKDPEALDGLKRLGPPKKTTKTGRPTKSGKGSARTKARKKSSSEPTATPPS